ncbi:hypothetical protein PV10_03089 [Exophiala mesophila]|uniref:Vps72/YL1 C-terminal domain-containing protein n=1 Tax=Exophiala mesophila TaxID=212818 RepID=A0A0D1Y429_EXOME|nr:uncharacterized protein PV10_03089 [Exophiala mesophila]KIV95431.1 hypothetical protein PV10_03089 [Exophiala mesophila]
MSDEDPPADTPQLSDSELSQDESDEEPIESLVAGRERRKTAGNRYDRDLVLEESQLDEEEPDEVTLLFAEDGEEEDDEFRSDEGEDDADMSSSDDDDQGPNAGADDLEGENELQKQAKAERSKKRKADLALTSVAGIRKKAKTIPTRPSLSTTEPKPKPSKKKERVTWIHSEGSGRSSLRKQTIAHRAETIQRLRESEAQSKKLKALKEKRDRQRAEDAPKELTQADRLAEAARVERQNAKSLNRWETMEKKRQEEQAAKLAALKNRKLDGPVLTYWSAKMKWVPPKPGRYGVKEPEIVQEGVKKKPGRKTKAFLEEQAAAKRAEEAKLAAAMAPAQPDTGNPDGGPTLATTTAPDGQASTPAAPGSPAKENKEAAPPNSLTETVRTAEGNHEKVDKAADSTTSATNPTDAAPVMAAEKVPASSESRPETKDVSNTKTPSQQDDSFLTGIHEFAAMEGEDQTSKANDAAQEPKTQKADGNEQASDVAMPDAESTTPGGDGEKAAPKDAPKDGPVKTGADGQSSEPSNLPHPPDPKPVDASSKANEATTTKSQVASEASNPAPETEKSESAPEEASKPSQEAPDAPVIKSEPSNPSQLQDVEMVDSKAEEEPEPIPEDTTRNVMILEKFDVLSSDARQEFSVFYSQKKATSKTVKRSQELCPITTLPVKYRDPSTGIGYGNATAYKKLRDLRHHKFAWSSMLGCYVGGSEQPPARGVPEGFLGT